MGPALPIGQEGPPSTAILTRQRSLKYVTPNKDPRATGDSGRAGPFGITASGIRFLNVYWRWGPGDLPLEHWNPDMHSQTQPQPAPALPG